VGKLVVPAANPQYPFHTASADVKSAVPAVPQYQEILLPIFEETKRE
jgi:hypothetical protein